MELIPQQTSGMRELLAIREAVRAANEIARPPASPACLIQVSPEGPGLGSLRTLCGLAVLGRSHGAEILVNDLSVSRNHARLELLPSGLLRLTDLGSMNGTFINDKRVASGEACEGDFVRFGNCAFRFLEATPPLQPQEGSEARIEPALAGK